MRCGCFWSRITGSHLVSDKADPDRGCRYTDAGGVLRLQKIGEARAYENRDREKPQGVWRAFAQAVWHPKRPDGYIKH